MTKLWNVSWQPNADGKIVIIRQKPCRKSLPQTEVDHIQCIERRRQNAGMFNTMTQILTRITGGKLTKEALLKLANVIADRKQIKIDRGAKRMKECLICWFCEHVRDVLDLNIETTTEKPAESEDQQFPALTIDDCEIDTAKGDQELTWESEFPDFA
jgi:hypothetical protein